MHWMLMPLRRYADFSGRSQRMEYWMFVLFLVLTGCAFFIVAGVFFAGSGAASNVGGKNFAPDAMSLAAMLVIGLFALLYLAVLVPIFAVQVRRFHDQDLSGWFVLLGFIPYLGGLIMLVFMCIEGTRGPNRFGPDPRGGVENHSEVFR